MRSRFVLAALAMFASGVASAQPALAQPSKAKQAVPGSKAPLPAKAAADQPPVAAKAPGTTAAPVAPAPVPAQAPAATSSDCTFVEIAATNGKDASFDPALKPLEKKLKKPPFTAWNTFKQLSSGSVTLKPNTPESLKLQQGAATLMLRGRSDKKIELTVTMDNAAGKRVLETKPNPKTGDWLILVGTNAKDDGHMLGLTCK